MARPRRLTMLITEEQAGKRVDTLLRRELQLSSGALRRAKRLPEGIMLDEVRVYSTVFAQVGQLLSVQVGDTQSNPVLLPMEGTLLVAYEDEDLLILDKAAPLAVHPSPTYHDNTLANHVLFYYQRLGLVAEFHPVNRLDRGTSGLMVVAKHAHAHERLAALLHTSDYRRGYLAVCEGLPDPPEGLIDAPMGRAPNEVLRRCLRPDGATARTQYRVLQSDGRRSLLELYLETGRTHQIRVHLASLGCPLVGDFLYGRETDELPGRFALHAAELSLLHPITKQEIQCVSPAPPSFAALLCGKP